MYINPHGHEDAWFIWNLDARFIYLARDFRVLYTPGGPGWHPDYPLMMSLNIVSGWVLLGQDSTRVPMALTSLFTLVLPGILFSGLVLIKDTKQAILACIILLASPVIIVNGASQQADTLVSAFVLASLALMALYFKTQEPKLLFLAGLTTGLSAWAKNEGYLLILVCTVLIFFFLAGTGKIRNITKYAAGLAIPLVVVMFYKFSIPVSNDLLAPGDIPQLLDWHRYIFILSSLADSVPSLGQWPVVSLVVVLLLYALLVWFEYPEPLIVKFIGLALLLQFAGYFAIYVLTPHDLAWHILTSKERLMLQIFPASLFLFFYAARSPNFNLLEVWKYATRH
ncbi:MAG TPA: glycosyltransferase family 39 protein [Anaerolineales bacterium]